MDFHALSTAIDAGAAARVIPDWTRAYLAALVAGRTSVAAVRHPLGFLCLPAWRGTGLGICVHIWTGARPDADPTTSAMHAHSWDLTSYVLYGRVRNQIIEVTDTGADAPAGPTHRVFEIHTDPVVDVVRRTERLVRCRPGPLDQHDRAAIYTLPSGVFHTSLVDGPTATVALGRDRPGTHDLSLGGVHTTDHRVRRAHCAADQTIAAARTVLANLDACRPVEEQCGLR